MDSVAHTAATVRWRPPRPLSTASRAPNAKAVPSMNVERPDTTWHHSENVAASVTGTGARTPVRVTTAPASQEAESPDTSVTGTTPHAAIRYGESTL